LTPPGSSGDIPFVTAPVLTDLIPGWDLSSDALPERLDTERLARAYRFSE
jgi:hypothetical protein